jgi:hypothetical protein
MTPEDIDRIARKRAGAKLRWYVHALVYVCVNAALFTLSGLGIHRWSLFPALGWGLGLALHGLSVWMLGSGSSLREQMYQRERAKLLRQHATGETGQPSRKD